MSRRRLAARLALALLVAALAAAAALNRERLDPAILDAWISGLGGWAPIAYVLVYALATIAFVPGTVFGLAGGALFGPVWGTVFNLLGATVGATLAFLVARYLAADWIARKAGGWLGRLIAGVEAEGWRFVAFVRLVPLFPFNLSNYAGSRASRSATTFSPRSCAWRRAPSLTPGSATRGGKRWPGMPRPYDTGCSASDCSP